MKSISKISWLFIIAISTVYIQNAEAANSTFCSTICATNRADASTACFGVDSSECWACAQNIFYLQKNSTGDCQLKPQNQIARFQLKNDAMDLSGYSSSKPGPQTCDVYFLSGQYVAGDYIQKTFTGLPLNHYQVVIRFGIGYIGTWNSADQMALYIDGQPFTWKYNGCAYSDALCSSSGADCFKIVEHVVSHDTATLSLNFSSLITETDPLIQYWGVKDLLIILRTCSSRCETCFGPGHADCTSCAPGFLLLGNLCVASCEYFALPSKRVCLEECPSGFFANSDNKLCETCPMHCLVCADGNSCSTWSPDKEGLIWEENKFFWILIIIIGFLILLYAIWKLFIRRYFKPKVEDSSLKKSIMSQNNIQSNLPQQETASKSNIHRIKNLDSSVIQKQKSNSKLAILDGLQVSVQEPQASWTFELQNEGVQQSYLGHHLAPPKKRKKKVRHVESEPVDVSIPSTIHLQGTQENLRL